MDGPTWEHVYPAASLAMDKATPEQVHHEASVATKKSMLQDVQLAVSMDKAMLEYLSVCSHG